MSVPELESLGDPHLQIAGLNVWVHDREFPNSTDYWDGNWLRVTACCAYPGSSVRVHGPIVHLGEIAELLRECECLYETLQGTAGLRCLEPNLRVQLTAKTGGRIKVELSITPDQIGESHTYVDGFDQTFLPPIIAACKRILLAFHVRAPDELQE